MAKKKPTQEQVAKQITRPSPICVALVISETAIIGNDNILSLIRIVDVLTLGEDEVRKEGEAFRLLGLSLVAMLKAGEARGKYPLVLFSVGPKGEREPIGVAPIDFENNPECGINLISPFFLIWHGEGLYWIELLHKESLVGRTPIHIVVDRKKSPTTETTRKP